MANIFVVEASPLLPMDVQAKPLTSRCRFYYYKYYMKRLALGVTGCEILIAEYVNFIGLAVLYYTDHMFTAKYLEVSLNTGIAV